MLRELAALELLDVVVGGASKLPPFDPNEWWHHTFEVSKGALDVKFKPYFEGNRLSLVGLSVFPANKGPALDIGPREVLAVRSQIADAARQAGFEELAYDYNRITGANPNRYVESVMNLKTGRTIQMETSMGTPARFLTVSGGVPGEAMMQVASRWGAEIAADPRAAGRGAARGAGALAFGTGLVESLDADGVITLPGGVRSAVQGFNGLVGTVATPLLPGHGDAGAAMTNGTGSRTAGFLTDAALMTGAYGAAAAVGGLPGVAALAAANGIDYLAGGKLSAAVGAARDGVRDFVTAGQSADGFLRDLGINQGQGSFGHALATEFRRDGTDVAHTNAALATFGQLYESQLASGADLVLKTPGGWGYGDADRQERLMFLKDLSLQNARDPSLVGGAVMFPDGTHGEYVDRAYADAFRGLEARGYGSDYLGERRPDEVLAMYGAARGVDTFDMMGNARAAYDAYDPFVERSSEFPDAPVLAGGAGDDGSGSPQQSLGQSGLSGGEGYFPEQLSDPLQSAQLGESIDRSGTSDVYQEPAVQVAAIDQSAALEPSDVYDGDGDQGDIYQGAVDQGDRREVVDLQEGYQPPLRDSDSELA